MFFIPAITDGRCISNEERVLLSLQVRLGGLGIPIFAECCKMEYQNSKLVCTQQVAAIVTQNNADNTQLPPVGNYRGKIVHNKREMQKAKLEQLRADMSPEQIRANDIPQMKAASSWLTTLPPKERRICIEQAAVFLCFSVTVSLENEKATILLRLWETVYGGSCHLMLEGWFRSQAP